MNVASDNAENAFAELKRQQVCAGHDLLARAAYGESLMGHGTSDVRYEVILESGKLIHTKGGQQYANLDGIDQGCPWDAGQGLFVLQKEKLGSREMFETMPNGAVAVDLAHIRWIILPQCEVDIARSSVHDKTAVARYRDRIVTYEEVAKELGFDANENKIYPESAAIVEQFRNTICMLCAQDQTKIMAEGKRGVETAASKGAAGIVEAAMILQEIMTKLPAEKRIYDRYEKEIDKSFERIAGRRPNRTYAVDKSWYAVMETADEKTGEYALYLKDDRRNVTKHIIFPFSKPRQRGTDMFLEW